MRGRTLFPGIDERASRPPLASPDGSESIRHLLLRKISGVIPMAGILRIFQSPPGSLHGRDLGGRIRPRRDLLLALAGSRRDESLYFNKVKTIQQEELPIRAKAN